MQERRPATLTVQRVGDTGTKTTPHTFESKANATLTELNHRHGPVTLVNNGAYGMTGDTPKYQGNADKQ